MISILLQNFTNLYKNIHFIAYFFETRFLKFIAYNSAFSGKEIATEGKNKSKCMHKSADKNHIKEYTMYLHVEESINRLAEVADSIRWNKPQTTKMEISDFGGSLMHLKNHTILKILTLLINFIRNYYFPISIYKTFLSLSIGLVR